MIEKEARFEGDRKLIASVIYNRLSKDMLLQIDATVLYGLGKSGGSLSLADLKVDGPYNTYINKGLVPTPISMISMSSLRAALNPEPSTFLYYVLKDAKTGEHAFANTYQEHLANIEKAKQDGALWCLLIAQELSAIRSLIRSVPLCIMLLMLISELIGNTRQLRLSHPMLLNK